MKYHDFLRSHDGCPFCSRGQGKVFENARAYMTYAIAPYHRDHILIVPKRHSETFLEMTPEELADIAQLQQISVDLLLRLGYKNITVMAKEGDAIEKSVPHMHYHIVPDVVFSAGASSTDRDVMTQSEISTFIDRMKSAMRPPIR